MKKMFVLLVIFAFIFTACDDGNTSDLGEIGKRGPGGGIIFFAEGG